MSSFDIQCKIENEIDRCLGRLAQLNPGSPEYLAASEALSSLVLARKRTEVD